VIHWPMDLRRTAKKLLRRTALPITICALILYFVVQLYVGDYGLPTHRDLRAKLDAAQIELAELQNQRERLRKDVKLIDPRRQSPPLLEEIARDKLKLVGPDELVIMRQR